jgi:transposase
MACPRCGGRKSWILKGGRHRCARCRFDWTPGRLPLRLTLRQWRALLQWFVRGSSSAQIAHETHLDRKRVLRALTVVRRQMGRSMPVDVSANGSPEPDEAVPESQGPNTGRPRSAVLGLRTSHGLAWAEIVSDVDTAQIMRVFRERKSERSEIQWPGAQRYVGVIYGGRLYRLAGSGTGAAGARFGHIESFWSYLQRRLKAKGGIRRQHLGLYLAEYAWRYNHRRLSPVEQLRETLKLVRRAQVEGMRLTRRSREQ